jgi:hypothetical protein
MHQDAEFENDALANSQPLKLALNRGCNVVEFF